MVARSRHAILLLPILLGDLNGASAGTFLRGVYPDFLAPIWPPSGHLCHAVTDCGAQGDGRTDDTRALQRCLDTCGVDGTGAMRTVLLRANRTFLSGALNLSSNLILQVDGELLASTDPSQYPAVPALPGYGICRDGGFPPANSHLRHQAFLSGWNLTNVWLVGSGRVDGRGLVKDARLGSSWVDRFKAKTLDYGRPRLVEPMFSRNFAIVNLTFTNQAFWAIHPYATEGVYIGGVKVLAPRDEGIPNDDGLDPDSCEEVLIEDSYVSVGDNSVAIKSGMDEAGRRFGKPSKNVKIQNSQFACETFAIGSEMSGSVYNVTVDNCLFGGAQSDFAGLHLKTKRGRGGVISDIAFTNSRFDMRESGKQPFPFSAAMFYGEPAAPTNASATPSVLRVRFENATILLPPKERSSPRGLFEFVGLPERKMRDFSFRNIRVLEGFGAVDRPWRCTDTANFTFSGAIEPPVDDASGCLGQPSIFF